MGDAGIEVSDAATVGGVDVVDDEGDAGMGVLVVAIVGGTDVAVIRGDAGREFSVAATVGGIDVVVKVGETGTGDAVGEKVGGPSVAGEVEVKVFSIVGEIVASGVFVGICVTVAVGVAVVVGWTVIAFTTSTLSNAVPISRPRIIKICSPWLRLNTLDFKSLLSGEIPSLQETVRASYPFVNGTSQIIEVSGSVSMPTKNELLPAWAAFTIALTIYSPAS